MSNGWSREALRARAGCRWSLALVPSGLGFVWLAYGQLDTAVARLWCTFPLERRALGCTRWCRGGGGVVLGRLHATGFVGRLPLVLVARHYPEWFELVRWDLRTLRMGSRSQRSRC